MPKKRKPKTAAPKRTRKETALPAEEMEGALLTPEMTGLPFNIFVPRKPKNAKKGAKPFLLVEARRAKSPRTG